MKKGSKLRDYVAFRRRAVKLDAKGYTQEAIAEALGVGQSTVSRWLSQYSEEGDASLEYPKVGGRTRVIMPEECEELRAILAEGAEAYGFTGDFWSRARVQEIIRQKFDIEYHVNTVGDLLRDMGITLQVPVTKNYRQKPEDVAEFKEKRLPAIKKKARDEGYVICYLDEAAFSFFPSVWRTYAPKGETPVVTHGPLYGGLQVMSLITENGRLHYQTKPGSFTGSDVVDFLRELLYHYRSRKLLIIWDGAPIHRSMDVRTFLKEEARGRVHLEPLPAYSPELNAEEQAHGYVKTNRLRNRLFTTLDDLRSAVVAGFEYLKERRGLILNFSRNKEVGFYPT